MTLIKSISGIRGILGGHPGEGLTPLDVVKFTAAYGMFIQRNTPNDRCEIIVGRDARVSGEMVNRLVVGTLNGLGMDVIDAGLATTPTVEMAVLFNKAQGGIIITASHNPEPWNALKLLNEKGEFLSARDGEDILNIAEANDFEFATVDHIGACKIDTSFLKKHIDRILELDLVCIDSIRQKSFHVVIDCVNSVGGIALPELLKALGVRKVTKLFCEPNGVFPHNPEPLPQHLAEISAVVQNKKADVGFVVDPDVDRLAIVMENGAMFGEEYTLVSVADYVLGQKPGNTVSNLSSTRALRDITEIRGGKYAASAVGEVNVVEMMKTTGAIIGGEGNGGVILPELHYGRDALVGIALFLSQLATSGKTCSEVRAQYPDYHISKNKIELSPQTDVDRILKSMAEKYAGFPVSTIDGVKIEFDDAWVHLRKSNTEPIIRVYTESQSPKRALSLANRIIGEIAAC